jgi:integrase
MRLHVPVSRNSRLTTCGGRAPVCAILPVEKLDQIQFLLGHASIQTTERYLGCKQKLSRAVNDRLGIEPPCNS